MRTAIVGAGPTGLYLGIALARRGHRVVLVDRDPGPSDAGRWERRGVMQFHHVHAFRQQALKALEAEMPDVVESLLAAGAVPATQPAPGRLELEQLEQPDQADHVVGLRCRRELFERVLRATAQAEPGVQLRTGHAEELVETGGRTTGVRIDGLTVDADLVLDATGRSGRLTRRWRGPAEDHDCGFAYVSRQYQLHPGASNGPMNNPFGMLAFYPGYVVLVVPQDNGALSTLIGRASSDRDLSALRHQRAFDVAARTIPALAAWTDPSRSRPITPVLPGATLFNRYQSQLDHTGRPPLIGLLCVGDAVCTTNPAFGRGVSTSLMQARYLVSLLHEHRRDLVTVSQAFDRWCVQAIRPWFADHVDMDAQRRRRWAGHDIDLSRPLPSDLVVAAAGTDPRLMPVVGPYLAMEALPGSLAVVQPQVRERYATGWRPPIPAGPSRDELADLVSRAVPEPSEPNAA
ncbi:MAG: FAD-dependent oxidoreductase [Dermatophilaceae bacterium]